MATYVPAKKNTAYIFYVSLVSQANPFIYQANPTLAAGDVKVATDDAAPGNVTDIPVVDADFTKRVKVTLTAGEMNGDNITVIFSDAAGNEWCDLTVNIQTVAAQIDDINAKTTNLPADPADQSAVEAAISALNDIAAADVLAETIEGAFDVTEALRLILAACAGFSSGGGTVTFILKNTANNKDRITATVDADGNRTGMVYDVT